jgi:hypothetical protein
VVKTRQCEAAETGDAVGRKQDGEGGRDGQKRMRSPNGCLLALMC